MRPVNPASQVTERPRTPRHVKPPKWNWKSLPRRYLIAILTFFGCFNIYSLRVNLSIAIVDMTANRTVVDENGTTSYFQEFTWNSKEQGHLLSGFFYGYISTQLIGGWLAPMVGGAKLFAFGILGTAVFTVFTPVIAKTGFLPFFVIRVLEGIFEGVTYPAMYSMWSHWAPPFERSRLMSIGTAGNYVGTWVSMMASGILADRLGWTAIFYVFGGVAILWCALWLAIVRESPKADCCITGIELDYIGDAIGPVHHYRAKKVPWKHLLTSLPVWSAVVAHFAENWGFFTLLTQLPMFLSDISGFRMGKTGLMAAIPYMVMTLVVVISGHSADLMMTKWHVSTTTVRKLFMCGAFTFQTIFMLATAFTSDLAAAVACLSLAVGLGGMAVGGFGPNILDIAPQYASVIKGLSSTFGSMPGIVSPTLTGYIVQHKSAAEWHIVFYIAAAIYASGCLFFAIFASGKLQPWAAPPQPNVEPDEDVPNVIDLLP